MRYLHLEAISLPEENIGLIEWNVREMNAATEEMEDCHKIWLKMPVTVLHNRQLGWVSVFGRFRPNVEKFAGRE